MRQQIWVAKIDNKHGTEVYLGSTPELLYREIYECYDFDDPGDDYIDVTVPSENEGEEIDTSEKSDKEIKEFVDNYFNEDNETEWMETYETSYK